MYYPGGGGAAPVATVLVNEQFTATAGQTAFNLAAIPNGALVMQINGVTYTEGVDFTLAGTLVTWLDVLFVIQLGMLVQFFYV